MFQREAERGQRLAAAGRHREREQARRQRRFCIGMVEDGRAQPIHLRVVAAMSGHVAADRAQMMRADGAAARGHRLAAAADIERLGPQKIRIDQAGEQHPDEEGELKARRDGVRGRKLHAAAEVVEAGQAGRMRLPAVIGLKRFDAAVRERRARAFAAGAVHQAGMMAGDAEGQEAAQLRAIQADRFLRASAAVVRPLGAAMGPADVALIGARGFADVVQQAHGQCGGRGAEMRREAGGELADLAQVMRQRLPCALGLAFHRMRIVLHA
ncbi:MAG TPA: hypothetical protein VNQ99_04070 [Xanthobacteraceae bacterium]|nr:hypothetical protein [Xanthobacteraceae bacterium]